MHNGMARYWAFRMAAALVPRLPRALCYRLARGVGLVFWALAPTLRRRAEGNLAHVPPLAADPQRLHQAVRAVFFHNVLNYLDFFRGHRMSDAEILASWTTEGEEALDAIMAEGRGLVLLTAHVSGFESGASRLGAKGFGVVTPVERLQPEALFQLVRRLREHHGLRFVPADSRETVRELIAALKHNEIAVFAVDRYITGASAALPFFGAPARMPTTPAALALRLGAPVGVAFSYRTAPDRAHAIFIPLDVRAVEAGSAAAPRTSSRSAAGAPVHAEATPGTPAESQAPLATSTAPAASGRAASGRAEQADAALRLQRVFLEHLERYVLAHPEQWISALSTVWEAT